MWCGKECLRWPRGATVANQQLLGHQTSWDTMVELKKMNGRHVVGIQIAVWEHTDFGVLGLRNFPFVRSFVTTAGGP